MLKNRSENAYVPESLIAALAGADAPNLFQPLGEALFAALLRGGIVAAVFEQVFQALSAATRLGLPPFAPLTLAATRLASVLAVPPFLPSWAIQRRFP